MSYIKYAVSLLLMLVGVWLSVELYQMHLQNVGEFIEISAYTKEEADAEDYIRELLERAEAASVHIVFANDKVEKNGEQRLTFYCEEDMQETLQKDFWYKEGVLKSIFFGTTVVNYKALSDINIKNFTKGDYACYPVGEEGAVENFLVSWQQDGNQILREKKLVKSTIRIYLIILWSLIGCIITCMTVFERMLGRKEFFVRLTIGESLTRNSLIHMAADTVMYFLTVSAAAVVIALLCGRVCFPGYAYLTAGILSLISVGLYVSLMNNSFRYAFSNAMMSEDTLLFGHFLLACFIGMFLLLFSFSCVQYKDYHRVAEQKQFYEHFEGYYRVSFEPYKAEIINAYWEHPEDAEDPFLRSNMVNRKFYEEGLGKGAVSVLCTYADFYGAKVCYVNKNCREYLEEKLGSEAVAEDGVICYYPKKYNQKMLEQWKLENYLYDHTDLPEMKWVPYEADVKVSTTGYLDDFNMVVNPIFVLDPATSYETDHWKSDTMVPYAENYYCKCTEEEILQYAAANDVNVHYEDVYGYFYEYYVKARNSFWCMFGISLILAGMIVFLQMTVIRLECRVNNIEMAIKKTLGVSLFERFFKVYAVTIGASIVGGGFAMILIHRMRNQVPLSVIAVTVVLIGVQLILVSIAGRKLEKESIQRVLKNG